MTTRADVLSGPFVYPGNGHSYYLLSRGLFAQAETEAQALGGHLSTINNAEEDQWVFETFFPIVSGLDVPFDQKDCIALVIGLNDVNPDDNVWEWVDGDPCEYRNWAAGQPQNNAWENMAAIGMDGKWYDYFNHFNHPFPDDPYGIAEVIPEPSTLALLGMGAMGLLALVRRRDNSAIRVNFVNKAKRRADLGQAEYKPHK